MPRVPGDVVNAACCSKRLYLEHPGQKITLTRRAIREQRAKIDQESYGRLLRQHRDQTKHTDQLQLGDVHHPEMYYNGQPIISFEEAAFGKRRQAIVDKTIAPLIAEHDRHIREWRRFRGSEHPKVAARADKEYELAQELSARAKRIAEVMRATPELVDNPGELVLDPILAEQMAYKANMVTTWKARGRKLLRLLGAK